MLISHVFVANRFQSWWSGSPVLTLCVPSTFEWVASPCPSNIGAKRSKVQVGQEKPNKNAQILTVNFAVLPSLSDTISLSSSPLYSESGSHPLSKPSTLCSLSSSMKSRYPMLKKTRISLISHRIFTDLNIKTMQWEMIELFPFIGRMFVLKLVSVWLCFPRQQK